MAVWLDYNSVTAWFWFVRALTIGAQVSYLHAHGRSSEELIGYEKEEPASGSNDKKQKKVDM